MTTIIFITRTLTNAIGPGGQHRSYQIEYDLKRLFGAENVHTLSLRAWRSQHWKEQSQTDIAQRIQRVWQRLQQLQKNPLAILRQTGYYRQFQLPKLFEAHYQELLKSLPPPFITVIDDARFAFAVAISRKHNIPICVCLHNLEALDQINIGSADVWQLRTHLLDLADEVQVLQQCNRVLTISKVETGLISGLGLKATYYPYLPVGAIRARLVAIAHQRRQTKPDPHLFVMLGSAMHSTTKRAFERFLQQIGQQGLPDRIRLVLVGTDTEKLAIPMAQNIETRGWLEQSDLDQLLTSARAVLIPQFSGFGAVTRITEMSCAGVTALISPHPTWAIDLPPGVQVVAGDWSAWRAKIIELSQTHEESPENYPTWDYPAWEQSQPRAERQFFSHHS